MTNKKLEEILNNHLHWLKEDCEGWEKMKANLSGAELMNKFFPIACPEFGSFIGWKKCKNNLIVKLEICEDAKRTSAFSRKCRCSAAKVLEIQNLDGRKADIDFAVSSKDNSFIYKVGEVVSVSDFDEDRKNECSTGIYFFITRQEAVDYML